ncbi:MAG: hypothetical protein WAX04_13770, partial [Oscillospiraceae bacterium]
LPVFLIENQNTSIKRRNKYGHLGDFRVKDYGGFEYRTPGSWLITPEITLAVLCLAKIVSSNYRKLSRNYFMNVEAQRAFYNGDQRYFKAYFEDIWRDIQRLDIYNEYKHQLEPIPNMINGNICWDEKLDIRKSWSLSKVYNKIYSTPKQPSKASVTSNRINNNNNTTNRRSNRSASSSNSNQIIPIAAISSSVSASASPYMRQGNPGSYV